MWPTDFTYDSMNHSRKGKPWSWTFTKGNDWSPDPSFEDWEATSGRRQFVHLVFHAAGTVWCLVWCECQALWSAGQKRPLPFWNHKFIVIDALDGNRKTPGPCGPAWLYGTVWCQAWSGSQALLSPGDVLENLFLIRPLNFKRALRSLFWLEPVMCYWTLEGSVAS